MSGLLVHVTIAFRNLVHRRRRTLSLGFAIAAVTTLLVLLNGLSTGAREAMMETATTLSSGHLNVGGFYKIREGQVSPVITDYQKVLEVVRREVPEMAFAVHRGRSWAKVVSDTGSLQAGVIGIDIRHEPLLARFLQIQSGRLADLEQPGTILLLEDQADKLGVKVGDALTLAAPTAQQGLSFVLMSILLAIVVIGIMNTMWIAIRERTREIGTLRAIGMQRRQVLWMFLLESLMLGLLATLIGALAGGAMAAAINAAHLPVPGSLRIFLLSSHVHVAVHPSLVASAIVTITLVTVAAAFYPSLKAARLRPIVAMSHFG